MRVFQESTVYLEFTAGVFLYYKSLMDRRYSFLMMFSVCDDGFWSGFNSSSLSNLQADIILMHVLFNVFVSSQLDKIRGTPQGNKGHNYHFIGILLAAGGGMVVLDRISYCKKFITNSSTISWWLRFLIVSDGTLEFGVFCCKGQLLLYTVDKHKLFTGVKFGKLWQHR